MKKSVSSSSTSFARSPLLASKKKVKKVAKKNPPSPTINAGSKNNLPLKKSGQLFFLTLALALLFAVAWWLGGLNLTKPSQPSTPSADKIESYDIYEVEAEILEQEATLYNDYFAFSYTLPPSYAVYEWWEHNLAKEPGETGRLSQFEFTNEAGERDSESSPNSGQKFISFIAYGNKRYSQLEDHFDVIVDAIKIAGAKVCSAEGTCVQCMKDSDCASSAEHCVSNKCVKSLLINETNDILKRLALQQEKNASIKKKIKGAMTYPIQRKHDQCKPTYTGTRSRLGRQRPVAKRLS